MARFESEARIKVDALTIFSKRGEPPLHRNGGVWLKPGAGETEWFRDLDIGPEMVVVPGAGDIPSFAIGRFTVTFAEWDAAQAHAEWQKHSGIDPRAANDHGGGRGRQPAIDVSWNDAKAYCKWLSAVTGKTYRLPSVAEWKHACRAGTMTEFWWGNEISDDLANFRRSKVGTLPVDSFSPNPWGLYQVFGNVWEWCEDPFGGSLSYRSTRGGSYHSARGALKEGAQFFSRPNDRADDIGIRVARTL